MSDRRTEDRATWTADEISSASQSRPRPRERSPDGKAMQKAGMLRFLRRLAIVLWAGWFFGGVLAVVVWFSEREPLGLLGGLLLFGAVLALPILAFQYLALAVVNPLALARKDRGQL